MHVSICRDAHDAGMMRGKNRDSPDSIPSWPKTVAHSAVEGRSRWFKCLRAYSHGDLLSVVAPIWRLNSLARRARSAASDPMLVESPGRKRKRRREWRRLLSSCCAAASPRLPVSKFEFPVLGQTDVLATKLELLLSARSGLICMDVRWFANHWKSCIMTMIRGSGSAIIAPTGGLQCQ